MAALIFMAKSSAPGGVTLTYPATTAYKQWVWKKIRSGGDSLQWLVDEMKRLAKPELVKLTDAKGRTMYETISTATLSDLLGREDEIPPPSNTKLMPAINKTLGIAPPPVCDPSDKLSQLIDRLRDRWARATPHERNIIEVVLAKGDDDETPVDRDRSSAGGRSR
jgi:hypothetical protein